MQRIQGAAVGAVVGISLGLLITATLHATALAAIAIAGVVGLSVFAVVATRTGPEEQAADAAWRDAAPDLPPVSDRVILERLQARLPGPAARKKPGRKPEAGQADGVEGSSEKTGA